MLLSYDCVQPTTTTEKIMYALNSRHICKSETGRLIKSYCQYGEMSIAVKVKK